MNVCSYCQYLASSPGPLSISQLFRFLRATLKAGRQREGLGTRLVSIHDYEYQQTLAYPSQTGLSPLQIIAIFGYVNNIHHYNIERTCTLYVYQPDCHPERGPSIFTWTVLVFQPQTHRRHVLQSIKKTAWQLANCRYKCAVYAHMPNLQYLVMM